MTTTVELSLFMSAAIELAGDEPPTKEHWAKIREKVEATSAKLIADRIFEHAEIAIRHEKQAAEKRAEADRLAQDHNLTAKARFAGAMATRESLGLTHAADAIGSLDREMRKAMLEAEKSALLVGRPYNGDPGPLPRLEEARARVARDRFDSVVQARRAMPPGFA